MTQEDVVERYLQILGRFSWGDPGVTEEEHKEALTRMQEYLDKNEPDYLSLWVRSPRAGQKRGATRINDLPQIREIEDETYVVQANGDLQILGGSIPVPEDVEHLFTMAWEHACESWPTLCGCGSITGQPCSLSGAGATTLVEWMPSYNRASHEAAGNRGRYPGNGSFRIQMTPACAESIIEDSHGWAAIITRENSTDGSDR